MDLRLERKNFKTLEYNEQSDSSPLKKSMNPKQANNNRAGAGSVNRNFIDSMGGIFGMSDEQQQ